MSEVPNLLPNNAFFQVLLLLTYKMPCASVSFHLKLEGSETRVRWLVANMLRSIWSPVEDEHHRLTSWPRLQVLGSNIPRASFVQRSGSTWKLHRSANSWRHVRAGTWATEPQKSVEQKEATSKTLRHLYMVHQYPTEKRGEFQAADISCSLTFSGVQVK